MAPNETAILDTAGLDALIRGLSGRGYTVIGPRVRDAAIVYDEIAGVADLPRGVGDEQAPGHYRLVPREDGALFGHSVGPHAWKKFLHPPRRRVFSASRSTDGFVVHPEDAPVPRYAFVGVRPCELAALDRLDRVLRGVDPAYAARRAVAFVVAVQCATAGGTCFCASLGTGPRATAGFDLALTELTTGGHRFVVETGSAAGSEVLGFLPHRPADAADLEQARESSERAARSMGRALETAGLAEALVANPEHPRWNAIAARCLSCANCTMSCPTCFCSTVEDTTDLLGDHAERWRRWDSCFTGDFSWIHGGSVRPSVRSRYRQWMTHKLGTWQAQFGVSGCVGCGRCITWCPAGIDITAEARAIAQDEQEGAP